MKRLEYNANNENEVYQYYETRAKQFAHEGYEWNKTLEPIEGGFKTYFSKDNNIYVSVYTLSKYRNKGLTKKYFKENAHETVITTKECNLENFLIFHNIPFITVANFLNTVEYQMVSRYYSNQQAKRSGCYLMNHIDEGLYILNEINASEAAKKAYCIHPLTQNEQDLAKNWNVIKTMVSSEVLGLALEYRNIANQYLSKRSIKSLDDIKLSPLKDVNDMLIADKVQNYKDFLIYHKDSHDRAEALDEYFNNWLKKLKIVNFETYFDVLKKL